MMHGRVWRQADNGRIEARELRRGVCKLQNIELRETVVLATLQLGSGAGISNRVAAAFVARGVNLKGRLSL